MIMRLMKQVNLNIHLMLINTKLNSTIFITREMLIFSNADFFLAHIWRKQVQANKHSF